MKKILTVLLFLICFIIPVFSVCSVAEDEPVWADENYEHPLTGEYINVYNWGEYISDGSEDSLNVNAEFTRRTGIIVNYTNFASNEDMYAKLKSGGAVYDIIIPSDYMIERLINEDMLEKIDYENITNFDLIPEQYRNLPYDKTNEYSVPYTVSHVGLIYNKTLVDEVPDSWNILWDKKYSGQILMFNNPRDAFAIAQSVLGINYNTTDEEDWDEAYKKLLEQKPLVQSYVMDEVFNKMENGEAALAPYYVGDFLTMKENNDDLEFVYPKESVNYFVDAVCIPKGCQNKTAAEMYIDFLLEPDIALANAEYICYGSPNTAVINNPDYDLYNDPYVYPDEVKTEMFENLPQETLQLMTDLWDELKIEGYDYTIYYIVFVIVLIAIVVIIIVRNRKKKKAEY